MGEHVLRMPGSAAARTVPAVEVTGVSQAFGERVALDDVSLRIEPGMITGLLGPNGAGKTTLMRILLGVIRPRSGGIRIDGRTIGDQDRRGWGYMPQERGLYPSMPAGEQVVYFARLHGLGRAEAVRRARALLSELDLAERWSDRTDRLSGGMQQQLQLAATLVHDPSVMVLDEPFAGLDPMAVAMLADLLRRRARAGCTVLLSSHQLDLVQDLCEQITMIDHGRVVLAGDVVGLRASSGRPRLRLHLGCPDRAWLASFPGVEVVAEAADEVRLSIPAGVDPLDVLDAARGAGRVNDFGLDLPTLSELFLAAQQATGSGAAR